MKNWHISERLVKATDWVMSIIRFHARLNGCEARLDALETKESNIKQEGPITIEEIDCAYTLVRNVHNPGVFNPKSDTNMVFVKEDAHQYILTLRARLIKQNIDSSPPAQLDVENKDSVFKWYEYLLKIRAQFRAGTTVQVTKVKRTSSKD